jgi:hypothetical protein
MARLVNRRSVVTKTTIVLGAMATYLLAGAASVRAQDSVLKTGFITVNLGAQLTTHNLATTQTLTVYQETATISSSQPIPNGPIFEIGGGLRVWGDIAVGARYSEFGFGQTVTSSVVASIPDPVFYDRPKTVTQTTTDLSHREHGIHVQATWFKAVTPKFDIALSGGPSFIQVSQEIATATVPAGSQTISVATDTQTGTALGFNAGFDGTYMFTKGLGAGLFVQFAQGTVDLPAAAGVKVGGLQSGLAVRMRF